MQTILSQMLALYPTQSQSDEKNALTEVIQEVALCGLSRAGFFKDAAFYGGTALRTVDKRTNTQLSGISKGKSSVISLISFPTFS